MSIEQMRGATEEWQLFPHGPLFPADEDQRSLFLSRKAGEIEVYVGDESDLDNYGWVTISVSEATTLRDKLNEYLEAEE